MLADVEFRKPDLQTAMILGLISGGVSGGGGIVPKRIGEGLYECGHWSMNMLGAPIKDEYETAIDDDVPTYGVCDTPEQVVEKFPIIKEHPSKFFISFVRLRRADQPRDGGWRWHKWGDYIGDRKPQCEYLHDEPEIEEVFTFHIYEIDA